MSLDDEFGAGTLRRAHSEELMSEVGLSRDNIYVNQDINNKKTFKNSKTEKSSSKHPTEDDQSLQSLRVSDKPVGQVKQRQRHNSAESAAEMSRKFPLCPEYADFYTGQVHVKCLRIYIVIKGYILKRILCLTYPIKSK
jgi:hypothetical protein